MARSLRSESERQAGEHEGPWSDVDLPTALRVMAQAGAPTLVHGHTHRPATEAIGEGRLRHVLSDWDLDHDGAARAEVLRWDAAGFTRLSLAAALARPPTG